MKKARLHLFVLCGFAAVLFTPLPHLLGRAISDTRFASITRPASGAVVVVAIDPRSLEAVGTWPWPRQLYADLIGRLQAARASDIALDIDFSASADATGDAALSAALDAAGGSVILPSFKQLGRHDDKSTLHINEPLPQFRKSSWPALVNVTTDRDSRVRSYPRGDVISGHYVPSMASLLAGRINDKRPSFMVDFGINADSIPVVSASDVLRGDQAALRSVRNNKVIIGGTAIELGDRFSVPRYAVISGPMLQALATESLIQHRDLRETSRLGSVAIALVIALVMMLLWDRQPAGRRVLLLSVLAGLVEAVAYGVQQHLPIVIDTSPVLIIIAIYAIACALDEIDVRGLLRAVAERRFQRIAMSLGDGLICADDAQAITFCNPAASAAFGYAADEIIGRPLASLFAGNAIATAMADFTANAELPPGGRTIELVAVRSTGERFPAEVCLSRWSGTSGANYGLVLRDITERKREEQRIRYLAEFDSLTGLPNRNAALMHLLAVAADELPGAALLCLSIDNLGQLIDIRGSDYGDDVICGFAHRLVTELDPGSFVARLADGEFALIVPDIGATGAEAEFAARLAAQLEDAPLGIRGRPQKIKISIGAIRILPNPGPAEHLLASAHLALYRARSLAGQRFVLYSERIRNEIEARFALEAELRRAVAAGEFELFFQPQYRLADGALVGAEALIRWRHPERGLVPPLEFMPIVNTSAVARDVADWVLKTACAQARAWELHGRPIRVAINLSPIQFAGDHLPSEIASAIASESLSPELLELEMTEDILLEDMTTVVGIVKAVKAHGVRVVFDDFGTGYASLSYLQKLPVDGIKLDRTFVSGMRTNPSDASIVGAMISLGRQLDLTVVAEGIEDGGTAELLRSMGCDEAQGYHFSKPVPVAEFEKLLFADSAPGALRGAA